MGAGETLLGLRQPGRIDALPADVAWRVFMRTLPVAAIRASARIAGDAALAARVLETVAIVG